MTTINDCEACLDQGVVLPCTMFSGDPDDVTLYLDDSAAKRYFEYPLWPCPVCDRAPHCLSGLATGHDTTGCAA